MRSRFSPNASGENPRKQTPPHPLTAAQVSNLKRYLETGDPLGSSISVVIGAHARSEVKLTVKFDILDIQASTMKVTTELSWPSSHQQIREVVTHIANAQTMLNLAAEIENLTEDWAVLVK